MFAGLGVLSREILVARNIAVVPWSRGIALFVPFALAHEIPILLYTALLRRACLQAFRGKTTGFSRYLLSVVATSVSVEKAEEFPKLLYAVLGSCLALLLASGASLLGSVLYTGPGGFAEVVVMMLAMLPLTLGYASVFGLVSAAIGGALGVWIYNVRHTRNAKAR